VSTVVRGRRVLDLACGEGYGSAMLAATATRVRGVLRSEFPHVVLWGQRLAVGSFTYALRAARGLPRALMRLLQQLGFTVTFIPEANFLFLDTSDRAG
jgi:hypothetical protein